MTTIDGIPIYSFGPLDKVKKAAEQFGECVEENRLDNALRHLGAAYGRPDVGNAAADMTLGATAVAAGNQALNYVFGERVPASLGRPAHISTWQRSLGNAISRATGSSAPATVGRVVGRLAAGLSAGLLVAEAAYNQAAMQRCAVVSAVE